MEINATPYYDSSDNPTNCCPRFNPDGWDNQQLHFRDKLFVKAVTRGLFHIPLNMGSVFPATFDAIDQAGAQDMEHMLVLSHDPSPWKAEHYFAVTKEVPNQEMVRLNGDFLTKVFEGPYKNAPNWEKQMQAFAQQQGKQAQKTYFFYTTCPKCARVYGKNYLVAVTQTN